MAAAKSSIACSTSTCADSTRMPVSGHSRRIWRAASSPSVVLRRRHPDVDDDQIGSTVSRTSSQQVARVAGLAHNLEV